MQLEKVNIEDVYPDKNNPRQKFEGIPELAESFDLNSERPGEPFTPPILVRDGGIYRIIDGERRYRALKHRRATTFHANVCEDMDEANTVMAMLATDDKQPLDELEKSRGVQTMLLLGVEPVKVEKAAKIKGAAKIKRAMDIVDDAAEDMTLDRMLAISEFADDEDVIEALTNCSESEWRRIYEREVRERESMKEFKELLAVLEEFGIPTVDNRPEEMSYVGRFHDQDELRAYLEEQGTDFTAISEFSPWYFTVQLYREASEDEPQEDPEEAAKREERDRIQAQLEDFKVRICKYLYEHADDELPHTFDFLMDTYDNSNAINNVAKFMEVIGLDETEGPSLKQLVMEYAWSAFNFTSIYTISIFIRDKHADRWNKSYLEGFRDGIKALIADGMTLEDHEQALVDALMEVEIDD